VAEATKREVALLDKTTYQLWILWQQGLSIIALDDDRVIGHAALVPLIPESGWYELGVVWVHPHYRHKDLRVALRLYLAMFKAHQDKRILATTFSPSAMGVGWRAGMVPIAFRSLPPAVWRETCCCPASKTGAPDGNNLTHCKLREQPGDGCFVRISAPTHQYLGEPELIALPVAKPTTEVVVPSDHIRILLSSPP
jgi:hypothetical protein